MESALQTVVTKTDVARNTSRSRPMEARMREASGSVMDSAASLTTSRSGTLVSDIGRSSVAVEATSEIWVMASDKKGGNARNSDGDLLCDSGGGDFGNEVYCFIGVVV